jgi:hypothetical protein
VAKQYEISGTDETWLAIFAGVPQAGAAAATFLIATFVNVQDITARTAAVLERSAFCRSYILCGLTEAGQPRLYSWEKGRAWVELSVSGQTVAEPTLTFWDIQKLFKHL